jgi:hypothetical protein
MDLATFTFFTTITIDIFRSDVLHSVSVAVKEEERSIVGNMKNNDFFNYAQSATQKK